MKLRIDLLRHGETTLSHTLRGSTNDELTQLGWQQMHQTIADQFETADEQSQIPVPWDVIFTSTLKRCDQFAQSFAQQFDLALFKDQRLQEMHFGDWEAISTQQIYAENPELLANFWQSPTQFTPPNAENLFEFKQRVINALAGIAAQMEQSNAQHALIVTHGGVIKLLKCIADQHPLDDILKMTAELGQLNRFILDSKTLHLTVFEEVE